MRMQAHPQRPDPALSFSAIQEYLGLVNPHPRMAESWTLSQAAWSAEEAAVFLCRSALMEAADRLGMPADFRAAISAGLASVRRDPRLFRYLWHCRWLLTAPESGWPPLHAGFPPLPPEGSPGMDMGYALVFLDLLPWAWERFRRRGCPDAMTHETLGDFRRWVAHYRAHTGRWGLSNLGWLQHHLRARLFALGRLQFRMETFALDFHAWREQATGRVLLLAGEGMRFRADGQFADADGGTAAENETWTATYGETRDWVEGYPIHPTGHAVPRKVRLAVGRWIPALSRENSVWGIHIPAGEPMEFFACGLSFQRATTLLPRIAPDHPARVWACSSWLLDPQFETWLTPDANTVCFLLELYLHPLPGATDAALFERVFDNRRPPLEPMPDGLTSMQRAVLEHQRRGGRWRAGGGVMFWDDLRWGGRVYRSQWPESAKFGLGEILGS